jgi:uncharacterized alpha-E superfamily protein
MLGRTANDLFWMSRYIERAENIARLLEVGYRIALLPHEGAGQDDEWRSTLRSAGCEQGYLAKYGAYATRDVVNFMLFDADNPSSVYSSLATARRNARAQRTALTREMWECLNSAWIEFSGKDAAKINSNELPPLFDWIKERSALFRGALLNTILRNDTFYFNQLGTFLERADNTARILDVKYHTLLPSAADVGGAVDYYQWGALLRSLSGFESYRKIYSDVITPRRVAELLILRDDMPRSLHSCLNFIDDTLELLCDDNSRELRRQAGDLHARLHYGKTEDIIRYGLHEYLMDFLTRVSALGGEISRRFLVPTY